MTDELRTTIETTLADADGLCLDNPNDRMVLTGLLLGRLRPALEPAVTGFTIQTNMDQEDVPLVQYTDCGRLIIYLTETDYLRISAQAGG